jgi:hypothetical protein
MGKQQLHSALAPIDVLTRIELEESLHKGFEQAERTRVRGLDIARIPIVTVQGNGGTVNLGAFGSSDGYVGPEQGDVWLLRRVNVVSSAFATDTARYIIFRGSTPSDIQNAYTNRFLLDAQSYGGGGTTTTAPAVPATTVPVQNPASQAYTVVITGGTVTAVDVNGVQVGAGDGTYVVPPYGSISVTYSAAPTWTWTATSTFTLGQQVGIAYNPGSKGVYLQPGEQIYAQIANSTTGNTYILTGEAIRVPAEMKGKVL